MGLVLLSLPRRRFSALGIEESPSLGLQRPLTLMAVAFLVSAVVANEWIAPYLAPDGRLEPDTVLHIRIFQAMLALAGIVLLMRRSVGRALEPLFLAVPSRQSDPRLLVIAIVVPWLILLFIVEPGRIDRFVGVWPLQVIVLAAFCETMFAQLRAARVGRWSGQVVIAGMIVLNPLLISRIDDWLRNGWSGTDSAFVPIADYLASLLRSEGKDRSSIGYQLFVPGPYVAATAVDARYKVGVQLDFLLEYRRGLVNVNQCAEGLSAHDEYRIVQPRPSGPDETHYFDVPFDSRFHLLRTIGQYQIYKRA